MLFIMKLYEEISIHAPRGGSDRISAAHSFRFWNSNPRSPWGERHGQDDILRIYHTISIHAPRGGSDWRGLDADQGQRVFQSTLPVGGATGRWYYSGGQLDISIHAPRGGSDQHHGKHYLKHQ